MIKKIFTNSFGILTSRVLGFLRDLLTAQILGANIYSDIFFIAFKLPNLFRRIFAEGAFVQSFLPAFTHTPYKATFAAAVFKRFFTILLLFSLIVTIFAPFFTKLIAFGYDAKLVYLASKYVAINFYYLDFIFCVTFLAALLQYKEHFATTAFATALLNISLIVALLLYQHSSKEKIVLAMSVAVLVGGFLQLATHLFMAKKVGILKRLCLGFKADTKKVQKDLKRFFSNFFPAIWGNSTAQVSAFLDTWLATFLSAGAISYLYYANRILQLPLALFAIATATALFPSVSKAIKNKNETLAMNYLKKSFWILTWLLLASAVGGILLSKEIIWLLFERGSFTRSDTLHTAFVLQMYMIGLLPYGLSKLFSLWLYAKQRQAIAAKIASYALIVNVAFSLGLIYFLQEAGLALASTIAGFVLLAFNIKEFGWKPFLSIIKDRKIFFVTLAIILEILLLEFLKKGLDGYIR